MIRYIFITLISIFLIGCAGGVSNQSSQQTLPNWVLNPKTSNGLYYYAVGEGANKNEAKNNALKQISGEISVTISSNTTITKKLGSNSFNKDIEATTKSSTEKIKFTGVKVLNNAFNAGTFYAYVQVNKDVLFAAQKKAMDLEYNKAIKLWDQIERNGVFYIFKENKNLNKHIINVMAVLPILKSINENFNSDEYSNKMQTISEAANKRKDSAVVYVKTRTAKPEKNVFEKAISDYGIKITKNRNSVKNKKNLIIISLNKKVKPGLNLYKTRKMRDVKFADVTLTVSTYNYNEKVKLGQNIIKLRNGSRDSYKAAVVKTKKLEREISQKGILNILLENISK